MAETGKVVVTEGPDDVGKSTLARRLTEHCMDHGIAALMLCEPAGGGGYNPGGIKIGPRVREMLAAKAAGALEHYPPETWICMMLAAMIEQDQHARFMVERGVNVIYDRREVSTLVYQTIVPRRSGVGSRTGRDALQDFIVAAARVLLPADLILHLDAPAELLAERRIAGEQKDQAAFSDLETQRSVVLGYRNILSWATWKKRTTRIDATQSQNAVFAAALAAVAAIIPGLPQGGQG